MSEDVAEEKLPNLEMWPDAPTSCIGPDRARPSDFEDSGVGMQCGMLDMAMVRPPAGMLDGFGMNSELPAMFAPSSRLIPSTSAEQTVLCC
jgi:hypothetical protein